MKAAWYTEAGPAQQVLTHGAQPNPEPGAGEVRVRIYVSGVNPSDVKARSGARGPLRFPFQIPHSDGAGIVERVGAGVDPSRVGERVYVWNAAWNRQLGTCAEYVCLPEQQAIALPESTDFSLGACIGIPVMTACHALMSDGPVTGKTVLVTGGAGTVGRFAIQLARWNGARVCATVSGEDKAAVARAAGAELVINYRTEGVVERVMAFTSGRGVERIVEVEFGGNLEITRQVIGQGGVIAAYGSMGNRTPALPFYELMFRHATIRMPLVYLLSEAERRAACHTINRALLDGALTAHIAARFSLDEIVRAHETVESTKAIGNVVIDVP